MDLGGRGPRCPSRADIAQCRGISACAAPNAGEPFMHWHKFTRELQSLTQSCRYTGRAPGVGHFCFSTKTAIIHPSDDHDNNEVRQTKRFSMRYFGARGLRLSSICSSAVVWTIWRRAAADSLCRSLLLCTALSRKLEVRTSIVQRGFRPPHEHSSWKIHK